MRQVTWVGGPVCGEVISLPGNDTRVTFDEELDTVAYRWSIPIDESSHLLWYGRTLLATFDDVTAERPPQ